MAARKDISTLSLAILGLLSAEPHSGYDVQKVFDETPMIHYSSSPGAIYPALARLERDGLVKGTVEKQESLRPRKVYRLTASGRRALVSRLRAPVTREDARRHMDDLLMRFALLDGVVGPEAAVRFLEGLRDRCREVVGALRSYMDEPEDHLPFGGRLAVLHGVESYQATIDWAEAAIAAYRSAGSA